MPDHRCQAVFNSTLLHIALQYCSSDTRIRTRINVVYIPGTHEYLHIVADSQFKRSMLHKKCEVDVLNSPSQLTNYDNQNASAVDLFLSQVYK